MCSRKIPILPAVPMTLPWQSFFGSNEMGLPFRGPHSEDRGSTFKYYCTTWSAESIDDLEHLSVSASKMCRPKGCESALLLCLKQLFKKMFRSRMPLLKVPTILTFWPFNGQIEVLPNRDSAAPNIP